MLRHLNPIDGQHPYGTPVVRGSTVYGTTASGGANNFGTVYRLASDGSGFTVLHHFGVDANGTSPTAGLARRAQPLYGTTAQGGQNGAGVVFKLRIDGTGYAVLHHFKRAKGVNPLARLHLATVGGVWQLFGTTINGGASGTGVIFKIGLDGTGFAVLHHFGLGPLGTRPAGGVIRLGSNLYGVTNSGGAYDGGVIYRIKEGGGGYTVLRHLVAEDGYGAVFNSPITDGVWLYGTLQFGGESDLGTIYKIAPNGTGFTVLRHFRVEDAAYPYSELVRSGSSLYGTTLGGGTGAIGVIFKIGLDGSDYAILHNFQIGDGANPASGLALKNAVLYGAASLGGTNGLGTIFKLIP